MATDRIIPGVGVVQDAGNGEGYLIPGAGVFQSESAGGGGELTATPTSGSLVLVGQTPATDLPLQAAPTTGTLVLSGQTPTVTLELTASPTTASLVLVGQTPTVSEAFVASPDTGALVISGQTPTTDLPLQADPSSGVLVLSGQTPTTENAAVDTAQPQTGSLILAGQTPTVVHPLDVVATAGSLVLSGNAPTVTLEQVASPSVASLVLAGNTPTVENSEELLAYPESGSIILTGHVPTVEGGEPIILSSGAAVGGWFSRRLPDFRRPTREEVQAERERLGILPPRAQKAIRKVVNELSDVETTEEAVAAVRTVADPSEIQSRIRSALKSKQAYYQKRHEDAYVAIVQALVSNAIASKVARERAEAEEANFVQTVLLPFWMQL